jgi:hypothetical protein
MPEGRFEAPEKFAQFDIHHWADWTELCCLENMDGAVSRKDMEKRLRESGEDDKAEIIDPEDPAGLSIDPEDEDIIFDDAITERVASWFKHLAGRAEHFGNSYPFELSQANGEISLRTQLNDAQRLYLLLLVMANLHYFGTLTSDLTADFERLSTKALRNLLPAGAQVHIFGKGGAGSNRYTGNVWNRIQQLAADLRAALLAAAADFPPQSTGDVGVDLVAWVPWRDVERGTIVIFAQCACTPQWNEKQHSSNPATWCAHKMAPSCMPLNAVFTPYFLRRHDGTWQRPADMGPYLHIDRLRLSHLLEQDVAQLTNLASFGHLNAILAQKADPT